MLKEITIPHFEASQGEVYQDFPLTYEVAGPRLGTAPLVLVNQALTGNSSVTGEKGWWNELISEAGAISPKHYTILAFNIPGNGYDGRESPRADLFSLKDVA